MSDSYTKLFRSIVSSTIVDEPVATRWLWVTMLSQADASGCVWGAIPGLARMANITLEECESGLKTFLSPDPYSRTKVEEGRRIIEIDGGWQLINHAKYDSMRSSGDAKERKREWDRQNRPSGHARAKKSDQRPTQSDAVRHSPPKSDGPTPLALALSKEKDICTTSPKAAQSTKEVSKRGARIPDDWKPTADLTAWAKTKRPDLDLDEQLDAFRDYWRSVAGAKGCKLDWDATYRNWIRNQRRAAGSGRQSHEPVELPEL